jgi:hypothetical protein
LPSTSAIILAALVVAVGDGGSGTYVATATIDGQTVATTSRAFRYK